jgi:hypothetical protein
MRALKWSIALILVGTLAIPQAADARGGGGGVGSGFHGASRGAFHSGNGFRHPGFVRNQQVARFADRWSFQNRRLADNPQNGSPAWWGGGWGWGYDWPNYGYGYGYQPTQVAPSQPQVIVIRSDGDGRITTTVPAADDYGYITGCHAIPNGYHCDTATKTAEK